MKFGVIHSLIARIIIDIMAKVFISYRRDDSADATGRIYDWLTARLGPQAIFRDVDDIPFGVDFKKYLEDTVSQCAMMLVVIGPQWLNIPDDTGKRRLDDPRDFVRIEVETALKRDIPVIPLLVSGANMPDADHLPSSLSNLAYRNGISIRRDPDFRPDMERLIGALEKQLGMEATPSNSHSDLASETAPLVLPMLEWCDVPAANLLVPSGIVRVEAFRISKYPVTNAQYQQFVDAAYHDERWWNVSPYSRDWHRANPSPATSQFSGDNAPREMVNWYEAIAFCHWLSHKLNLTIILPTEQQWHLASQGPGKQEYPWGDGFDRNRCNTKESNINRTTPVDRYPAGVSPYGAFDMLGNVWEWTLTERDTGTNNLSTALRRTIRGGSWHDYQNNVRAATRGSPIDERTGDLGFRLATTR